MARKKKRIERPRTGKLPSSESVRAGTTPLTSQQRRILEQLGKIPEFEPETTRAEGRTALGEGGAGLSKPETGTNLEDILVALQKTFSRVSTISSAVPEEQARALLIGRVHFDLALRADVSGSDRLVQSSNGALEIKLAGEIDTDIRPRSLNEDK